MTSQGAFGIARQRIRANARAAAASRAAARAFGLQPFEPGVAERGPREVACAFDRGGLVGLTRVLERDVGGVGITTKPSRGGGPTVQCAEQRQVVGEVRTHEVQHLRL